MRVAKLQVRIAMLAVVASLASSCQTAQKPASLLPARTAPVLTAPNAQAALPAPPQAQSAAPAAAPQTPPQAHAPAETKAQPLSAQSPSAQSPSTQSPSSAPASDPVGDLVAKVEKDYLAGLNAYQAGQ